MNEQLIADAWHDVTITQETTAYSGFRSIRTWTYRETESGLEARRELIKGGQSVVVIAYDPALDRLVLIRQFRLGAQLGTGKGMTVELVAGLVEEGEDPAHCAARELKEESGLEAQKLVWQCQFLTTPGMTDEVVHVYFTEVDASNLAKEAGAENETEQTFPFLATLDEALAAIDSHGIKNGIVMVALFWLSRHKDSLLRKIP